MICPSYLLNEGQSVNNLSINWAISRCFAFVFVFRVHTATDHQTCVIEYDSPFWRARQGCAERKPAPSSNALLRAHAILPLLFLLAGTCLNGTETAELPVCPWHPGPHKVDPHVTGIERVPDTSAGVRLHGCTSTCASLARRGDSTGCSCTLSRCHPKSSHGSLVGSGSSAVETSYGRDVTTQINSVQQNLAQC